MNKLHTLAEILAGVAIVMAVIIVILVIGTYLFG